MEQNKKTVTIELLPYHQSNKVRLSIAGVYENTFDTLHQACKELSEQDMIAKISSEMHSSDAKYSIRSTPYKDGVIHYNPNSKFPYSASYKALNAVPMRGEVQAKRWITATMERDQG